MRIRVEGECESARVLRGKLEAAGYATQSQHGPDYVVTIGEQFGGPAPVILDGIDCRFEQEVLTHLHRQGVPRVWIQFEGGVQSDRAIKVLICDSAYQLSVEEALLNAILQHTGKRQAWKRALPWYRRILAGLALGLIASSAEAQLFPTTVQFWDGATVVKAVDVANNALRVNVVASVGGGGSGTSSSFGAAFPASGTAAGFTDGTNMQPGRVFDADTGGGTQYIQGVQLRKGAAAGSVEAGTSTDPLRIDPTGTTAQPITAAALPLPTGAATETTLGTRLAEATFTTRINTQGQKAMAASTPVVIASDQSAVATSITAGNFPDNEPFNLAQYGGSATTLGQKASSASVPTVLSSDYYLPTKSATGTLTGTTCSGNPGSGTGCFTMAMDGMTSIGLTLNGGGTGVLTYVVEFSGDGVVYSTTYMWSWLTSIKYLSRTLPNPNVAEQFSLLVGDGAKYIRVRATAFTSGSSSFTITGNNTPFPVWYQSGIGGLAPVAGITIQGVDGGGLAQYPRVTDDLTVSATLNGNVLMSEKGARWSVTSNPAVSTQATASKAAGAAGVKHVADCITYSASAGVAPAATLLSINLRDGATGAGTVLASWRMFVPAAIGQMTVFAMCDLNIPGTAATAMTLEFSALLTSLNESVTLTGYSVQ